MTRAVAHAALLGVLLGACALMAIATVWKDPALPASAESAVAARATDAWPICTSMGSLGETADWAQLDPDFVLGLQALSREDWTGAISMLAPVALRDARNADIQNYLGYAHYRLRRLDAACDRQRRLNCARMDNGGSFRRCSTLINSSPIAAPRSRPTNRTGSFVTSSPAPCPTRLPYSRVWASPTGQYSSRFIARAT